MEATNDITKYDFITTTYSIPLSSNQAQHLLEMDEKLIGTSDYMGLAYFWNYEYRILRDATPTERRRLHDKLLALGRQLDGQSKVHESLISQMTALHKRR